MNTSYWDRRAKALDRDNMRGQPREKRIAAAKRKYEIELRAAGLTRSQAKRAVAVRFSEKGNGR